MKLSKAQEKAIYNAKRDIEKARAYDIFEEYVGDTNAYAYGRGGAEYVREHIEDFEYERKFWERYRQGDVLTSAGKNTIEALCRMGIFSKPEYSSHRSQGVIDWVHYNEDWEA